MKTGKVLLFLCGLILMGCVIGFAEPEEKTSEKDRIIANLRNNFVTNKEEIAKIKQGRQIQIEALTQILSECQKDMNNENYRAFRGVNYGELVDSVVELLGELRAAEVSEQIVNTLCFNLEVIIAEPGFSSIWFNRSKSAFQNALVKIGTPSIEPLINVLGGTTRMYITPTMIEIKGKENCVETPIMREVKSRIARQTLYLIEGECAIHQMERALREETDEKKKSNLSSEITKFREELKSGIYNK